MSSRQGTNTSPPSEILIQCKGVGKKFNVYDSPFDRFRQLFRSGSGREFWALKDVNFDIKRGESVGIVGRNGAGKSTLLQLVTGTLAPSTGTVTSTGRVAALLQLGSGFNPEFTGRENVYLNGAILGLTRRQVRERIDEILEFADIGEFVDQPVKNYSSGMAMRLAFAVSTCLEPEVLIVDEALAVGDALFQRKCYTRLDQFVDRGGSLLFVSHSLETVKRLCDRAIYLEKGSVKAIGAPNEVASKYEFDMDRSQRTLVNGTVLKESHQDYGNRLATIIDFWLEDEECHRTDSIPAGQPFNWCYQVTVSSPTFDLSFGMKMVNMEGLTLYATNSAMLTKTLHSSREETRLTVRFRIQENNLTAGIYFLSAGVSQNADGRENFVHRLVDCAQLTILQSAEDTYAGMINMNAMIEVI